MLSEAHASPVKINVPNELYFKVHAGASELLYAQPGLLLSSREVLVCVSTTTEYGAQSAPQLARTGLLRL